MMGVDWRPKRGLWRARISVNQKRTDLGEFTTEVEARAAYDRALELLGPARVRRERSMADPGDRFRAKTQVQPNGCVLWLGCKDKDGYGKFQLNGGGKQRHVRAHRFAFFMAHGQWPSRLALHSCDTPSCVNPAHLEDGDQGQNVRDCVARGRHRPGRVGRRRSA
jgi:hypothetical protein